MKDFKQTTQQYVALDGQKTGGCSLGCMGIGCLGAVALMFMMCGGGFYGLLYSSLPLKALEAAIESEGEVKIEGLKGNITNGFTADEVRFRADGKNWSDLQEIKFKYSNNRMFNPDRFVVEEVSVNGGTIYADWDPEKSEIAIDPDFEEGFEEFEDELEEINDELEGELGPALESIKEVRVDLVRVANLKVVNPDTKVEFTLDEIKFDGFHWEDGELISFGELLVRSSQLELDTVPSIAFADKEFAQRFQGTIKSQMDHRLKGDVDFAVDFALIDGKFHIEGNAIEGAVKFSKMDKENSLTFTDFTPVEIFEVKENQIAPSEFSFTAMFGDSMKDDPESVTEDGSFRMGKTVFSKLFVDSGEDKTTSVAGVSDVYGTEVTAKLLPSGESPFWIVTLSSEADMEAKELWAKTVFGKAYNELGEENQAAIDASSKPRPKRKRIDMRENKDEGSIEDNEGLGEVADEAQDLLDEIENDLESESEVDQSDDVEAPEEEPAPFPIGADDGR